MMESFLSWIENKKVIVPVQNANQKSNYDCGPAALRAIAKLFGYNNGQDDLIDKTDADKRKGSHPEDLLMVAHELGMKAVAKKNMTLESLLKQIREGRPVICAIQAWAHKDKCPNRGRLEYEYKQLKHGHYVVAMGYDEKYIYFEDPSIKNGKRGKLKYDEFLNRWYDKNSSTNKKQPHLGIIIWDDVNVNPEYKTKSKKIP